MEEPLEILAHVIGGRMLGSQQLAVNRQRALEQSPRSCEIALMLNQVPKIIKPGGGMGLLGAEDFLVDRQSTFE